VNKFNQNLKIFPLILQTFTIFERFGLISDAFSLSKTGSIPIDILLNGIVGLMNQERCRIVWHFLDTLLVSIGTILKHEPEIQKQYQVK